MRGFAKILSLSFVFIAFSACQSTPKEDPCLETRGALDVGSGSTKALVAVVNTCEKRLTKVLLDEQIPAAFSEAFERSNDRKIPQDFVDAQIPKMKALVVRMNESRPKSISGVATSTFRSAKNGLQVAEQLSAALNVPIEVISQEEEAKLGYWSAMAKRGGNPDPSMVVWDIGGGSMQMIRMEKGEAQLYEGKLAAVAFKNRVLSEIKHEDPKIQSSPNPLGSSWEAALKLAKEEARKSVPKEFKSRAAGSHWVGIGGVLARSVREQVGEKEVYRLEDIRRALEQRSKMTDAEIGGPYSKTDVTNLALVAGYFEALGIKELEAVSTSLGQGRLLLQLQSREPALQIPAPRALAAPMTAEHILEIRGPHLVRDALVLPKTPRLMITLGGTTSSPNEFAGFASLASAAGYHVLSLDYPNMVSSAICREKPYPGCSDQFREEISVGGDLGPYVEVDAENSILNRIRAAVATLSKQDPSWAPFWTGTDVDWSKTVMAGHSQGAGHAAFLSKRLPLRAVVLFAGPQDIVNGKPPVWMSKPGATKGNRYYLLTHPKDFFGSEEQIRSWKILRRTGAGKNVARGNEGLVVSNRDVDDPHNAVLRAEHRTEWARLLKLLDF